MAKARRENRWTARTMRVVLKELERSGQTQRECCRARGIPLSTLTWWRKRLGESGAGPKRRPVRGSEPRGRRAAFHQVELMPSQAAGPGGAIEVVLPDATVIKIPDEETYGAGIDPPLCGRAVGVVRVPSVSLDRTRMQRAGGW